MNWKISVLILALVFFNCKKETSEKDKVIIGEVAEEIANIPYLLELDEFLKIKDNPNIKIIDFRKPEIYVEGHLPNAINIWRSDIEDSSYEYVGMMASKEQIEDLFSNLGISNDDTLVIYDDNGLCDSSRLWWVLQNYDFINVKLLHGGIKSWKSNNNEISTEKPQIEKTEFKLPFNPSMKYYVSKEDMLEAISDNTIILDTRTSDEYSGKRQKKGAAKGGRIPNSKSIDWAMAINYKGDMKLKPVNDLKNIYKKVANEQDIIIAYCHSGVRSAHTTFVLTQVLGYKNVKNYDGSWTEWSHFNDLSIEQDSITTIKN